MTFLPPALPEFRMTLGAMLRPSGPRWLWTLPTPSCGLARFTPAFCTWGDAWLGGSSLDPP